MPNLRSLTVANTGHPRDIGCDMSRMTALTSLTLTGPPAALVIRINGTRRSSQHWIAHLPPNLRRLEYRGEPFAKQTLVALCARLETLRISTGDDWDLSRFTALRNLTVDGANTTMLDQRLPLHSLRALTVRPWPFTSQIYMPPLPALEELRLVGYPPCMVNDLDAKTLPQLRVLRLTGIDFCLRDTNNLRPEAARRAHWLAHYRPQFLHLATVEFGPDADACQPPLSPSE
jgi:hypothetical protein